MDQWSTIWPNVKKKREEISFIFSFCNYLREGFEWEKPDRPDVSAYSLR